MERDLDLIVSQDVFESNEQSSEESLYIYDNEKGSHC